MTYQPTGSRWRRFLEALRCARKSYKNWREEAKKTDVEKFFDRIEAWQRKQRS